jgi:hypothetical protein
MGVGALSVVVILLGVTLAVLLVVGAISYRRDRWLRQGHRHPRRRRRRL